MQFTRPYLAYENIRDPRKELQSLYARRSTIDALIRSLEEYNRHRAKRLEMPKRKSA
jgi:hypothetical protein